MSGRSATLYHHPSITIAAVLWAGALCSAWHDEDRDDAIDDLILAAAATAAVVAAISRVRVKDLVEAHWAGFNAGRAIGRTGEAG